MERRSVFVSEDVERHGQAAKRIQSLCDMHQISFGAPGDLKVLVHSLREDRHFAMDFWAMVGDMSARERGTLDDEEMIGAIVEGSTGLKLESLPQEDKKTTDELRQLLAGVDVEAPVLPDAISEPEDTLLEQRVAARARAVAPKTETNTTKTEHEGPISQARVSIADALLRLEETSRELREQLVVIEQIKAEQAQAEQAVSRQSAKATEIHEPLQESELIEPEPEEPVIRYEAPSGDNSEPIKQATETPIEPVIASVQEPLAPPTPVWPSAPPEPPAGVFVQAVTEPAELEREEPEIRRAASAIQTAKPMEQVTAPAQEPPGPRTQIWPSAPPESLAPPFAQAGEEPARPAPVVKATGASQVSEREIFAPRPAHTLSRRGLAPQEIDDDPSIVVPLSDYVETHGRNGVVVATIIVLLLVFAGSIWFALNRGHAQKWISDFKPAFENKLQLFRQEWHDVTGKGSTQKPDAAQQSATSRTTAAPPPPVRAAVQKPMPPVQANTADSKLQQKPPQKPETRPTSSRTKTPVPSERAAVTPTVTRETPSAMERGAVKVPSSTMEGYLVSSRVPAYPEAAKAMGLGGAVVMVAVISKSGIVEQVRVLQGDPRLRAAAEDAVKKWRYKPYLLNGRPVEVATQVRVAFNPTTR